MRTVKVRSLLEIIETGFKTGESYTLTADEHKTFSTEFTEKMRPPASERILDKGWIP